MAKTFTQEVHEPVKKRTSIGNGKLLKSGMNKNKKASFKAYRGQGR